MTLELNETNVIKGVVVAYVIERQKLGSLCRMKKKKGEDAREIKVNLRKNCCYGGDGGCGDNDVVVATM